MVLNKLITRDVGQSKSATDLFAVKPAPFYWAQTINTVQKNKDSFGQGLA
jgi:hypothetical protein